MKILNLYAGLGGNRKQWEGDIQVTAVELDESIAKFYKDRFPQDEVIVGDAHQFLLHNYRRFQIVWSSTPCPKHSRARFWNAKGNPKVEPAYPDMKLYEEIIFLKHFFDGRWVVENVVPYYKPLIPPSVKIGRHLFWSNFDIRPIEVEEADCTSGKQADWEALHGFSLDGYKFNQRKDKILRNCVTPQLGDHIFKEAKRLGLLEEGWVPPSK